MLLTCKIIPYINSVLGHCPLKPEYKQFPLKPEYKYFPLKPEYKHCPLKPEYKHFPLKPEYKHEWDALTCCKEYYKDWIEESDSLVQRYILFFYIPTYLLCLNLISVLRL
uniref:Uncharacterized protein n=1 Tax=Cacopsylla melanoneura TaxID=428564 RepID=A0A8D8QW58_9HEMI